MKKLYLLLLAAVGFVSLAATLDLANLFNYANQPVPLYITRDNTPEDNLITDEAATLGRVLFYDTQLSVDNSVSCATCHQQRFAFSDTARASIGVNGATARHSMRLVNARFSNEVRFFWNERAASLEAQTTEPIQDHAEMGFSGTLGDPDLDSLIRRMESIDYYPALFEFAFGDPAITEDRMQKAMAQFIRSIQVFDSRYDEGRALTGNDNPPFPNFTPQENNGKQLFLTAPVFAPGGMRVAGGLGCGACHRAPEFDIDPASGHNGVTGTIAGGPELTNTRSPSLRHVFDTTGAAHGPFMHNGQFASVNAVLDHYNVIPGFSPGLDPRLAPGGSPQRLNLTPSERIDVLTFLMTLSGNDLYTNPKWSDPFEGGSLNLAGLGCGTPDGLITQNINPTTTGLRWNAVNGATAYRVQGKNLTTGSLAKKIIPGGDTTLLVKVLSPGTSYAWTVEAACSTSDISGLSMADTFTTLSMREPALIDLVSVTPNPARYHTTISGLPSDVSLGLVIMDASGRLVRQENRSSGPQGRLELDVSDLMAGMYLVQVSRGEWQASKRLIITE